MKTTIDMADALLIEARLVAAQEGSTLRALVEEGLRLALPRRANATPFKLRDCSVDGRGLQAGVPGGDWDAIRAAIYEGRGG